MVGFFGMNVDTFKDDPSIKWSVYAISISSIVPNNPLSHQVFHRRCTIREYSNNSVSSLSHYLSQMLLILALWFILKHYWAKRRQTPYQRGIYEHLFHDLSNTHPRLWSRSGPRPNVQPSGFLDQIKWRLIAHWTQPSRTIALKPLEDDDDVDDILGSFSRLKRYWMRKWTAEIEDNQTQNSEEAGVESYDLMERGDASSPSNAVITTTTQQSISPPQPQAQQEHEHEEEQQQQQQQQPVFTNFLKLPLPRPNILRAGMEDQFRPSTRSSAGTGNRNSGILVEEKELGWLKPFFIDRRTRSPSPRGGGPANNNDERHNRMDEEPARRDLGEGEDGDSKGGEGQAQGSGGGARGRGQGYESA